jgi:hypothetical protein
MRKTSKAVLSAGLAAATVISGLSFGVAAATAAPSTTAGLDRIQGKFVTQSSTPGTPRAFGAVGKATTGVIVPITATAQLTDAVAAAAVWTFPAVGTSGPVVNNGLCLTYVQVDTDMLAQPCVSGSASQQFLWSDSTGQDKVPDQPALAPVSNPTKGVGITDDGGNLRAQSYNQRDGYPLLSSYTSAFSGRVTASSVAGRSATVEGTASPNASIIYRVNGGPEKDPKADADGNWSVDFTALKLGVNTVHFEEWVPDADNGGNKKTGEIDLEIDLKVAPVTAKYEFDAQQNMPVAITGSAEPSALVEIKDASGKVVAQVRANDVTGNWETTVPAPNAGGNYAVTVDQKVDGETVAGPTLTINYGAGVVVTSPVNDKVHDGGKVAMSGTGEPGGQVEVREQGKTGVIGDATVLANGRWNLDTTDLNAKKHVLEVTQKSKGNNTTTATVTLNPDADQQDVSVTSPKNGDQYDANTVLRFTGEGTPGAQIELDPNNGLSKYYATVKADGTWSIDRPMGTGAYTFSAIQRVDGVEQSRVDGIGVTAKSTAPIEKPFTLTSPAANSFHQGVNVTFTGEGKPGDTIRLHVTNFTSADVTTTVKNDGTWSVSKYLGSGAYTFDVTQENAGTVTGAVRGFELNQSVDKPFTVTSPSTGTTFTANTNVAFTGTGPVGAAITVKPTNGLAPVNTVITANGTWTVSKFLGNGSYTFEVTMTPKTGTPQTSAPITLTPAS